MSFEVCLAGLEAAGTIDPERAARFRAEFKRLNTALGKKMGAGAAVDVASRETMDALEFQLMNDRRQAALAFVQQKALLGGLTAHLEAGGHAGHYAMAVMEHHEAVPGVAGVENVRGALWNLAWSRAAGFLSAHKRDVLGRTRNRDGLRDLVRELRGEASGNKDAAQLAAAVSDMLEWLRKQYNAAGGAIGKLDGWGLPQSHDALSVAQAGYPAWRAFLMTGGREGAPLIDFARMIDQSTGKPFASEDALEEALTAAWRNIASEGMDGNVPGAFRGDGKLANRRADHRFFVFKDADAWLAYNERFGHGDAFDAIVGHVAGMTRDIAAMRVLGPNPAHTVRWLQDMLNQQAIPGQAGGVPGTGAAPKGMKALLSSRGARKGAQTMERMWRFYSGEMTAVAPENRATARFFTGVRNWNVLTKLGRAALSAIPTDPVFKAFTARFNGMPVSRALGDWVKTFNPADAGHREAAEHAGLIVTEMVSRAAKIYSETRGLDLVELTRRGADGLLRTTLLSPHTQAAKQAGGLSWMKEWAELADTPFDKLGEGRQLAFARYGIEAADWDRLRSVPTDDTGGVTLLRPGDLARLADGGDQAALDSAVKFFTLIDAEGRFDTPGSLLRAQTALALGGQGSRFERGTLVGELAQSATQFKTYSFIVTMTHIQRAVYGRGAMSRAEYALALPIFLTVAGTLALSLRAVASGEYPPDWTDPTTWARGFVTGGGLGYAGDIIGKGVEGQRGTGGAVAGFVTGPTIGSVVDPAIELTLGNIGAAARGEETNLGRESLRLARRNVPGGNAWYGQLAVNRMLLDQLETTIDPDYRKSWRRMERDAAERGQPLWWRRGAMTPDRAPDFENAFEEGTN